MLKGLVKFDVVEKMFRGMLDRGWTIDSSTGKMTARMGVKTASEWIHPNPDPGKKCNLYQEIFSAFNFIPRKCLDCWKVVVKPRTLFELMKVYAFQKEFVKDHIGVGRFCKCGIETREYVNYEYGAYFYCDSLKHGLHRHQQVRNSIDEINPGIPVILKRYCTEFELGTCSSDMYVRPEWADAVEELVFGNIDMNCLNDNPSQPKFLVEHNIRKWIEFAWDRADPTATMFNDNEPLYTPCLTYHDMENPMFCDPMGQKHNVVKLDEFGGQNV